MTVVAVITQPLRVQHCAAFLRQVPDSVPIQVVTPDERAFASSEMPVRAQFRHFLGKETSRPTHSISESRLRQWVVRWARGGSTWGMRFDRVIRSAIWRLRYLDRLMTLKDLRRSQHKSLLASHEGIAQVLAEIHLTEEISELVVFDVFDLPPVLKFGETHSIAVAVR